MNQYLTFDNDVKLHIEDVTTLKQNCVKTFENSKNQLLLLKNKVIEKKRHECVLIVMNLSDINGRALDESFMSNPQWKTKRAEIHTHYILFEAKKNGTIKMIETFDKEASKKLIATQGIPVVIIDYEVAEIFEI